MGTVEIKEGDIVRIKSDSESPSKAAIVLFVNGPPTKCSVMFADGSIVQEVDASILDKIGSNKKVTLIRETLNKIDKRLDEIRKSGSFVVTKSSPRYQDISGKTYGSITVLEDTGKRNKDQRPIWMCQCNKCGERFEATKKQLLSGKRISKCPKCPKVNVYDMISFDFGVCYTSSGVPILFDKEDYDLIKDYTWSLNKKGYAQSSTKNRKLVSMHRLIMNPPDSMCVDHINTVVLDNRKSNLRVCTYSQNSINKKTIGYTKRKRLDGTYDYVAQVQINGKTYESKSCSTPEEALQERLKMLDENHVKFGYNEEVVRDGIENYERVLRLARNKKQMQSN